MPTITRVTKKVNAPSLNKPEKELFQKRALLIKKREGAIERINKQYGKIFNSFVKKIIPYKIGDVLEVVKNPPRQGFKRFVIYDFGPTYLGNHVIVDAWGWWLDDKNTPLKWDSVVVYGAGASYELKKSDNQRHNRVPSSVRCEGDIKLK